MRITAKRMSQLALVAVVALLLLAAGDDARFSALGHKLMCRCGCNQVLLECNHVGCEYSERMRAELTAALQRGDTDNQILDSFVQKYGPTVLAAPTTQGFNVVAWIAPFVALGIGAILAVWVVRAWKGRAQPAAPPSLNRVELEEFRQRARRETEI